MIAWLLSPLGRAVAIAAVLLALAAALVSLGARWQAARDQVAAVAAERDALLEERAATARLLEARAAREAELLASLDRIKETADALAREARQRPAADRRLVRDRERLLAIRPRPRPDRPAARSDDRGALP